MLQDTLVIWGGEFGRTPMAQGSGRDHHIKGFSIWMAGEVSKEEFPTETPMNWATMPKRKGGSRKGFARHDASSTRNQVPTLHPQASGLGL